jgi:tetratricopeptide (TPR) repeat protein
LFKVAHLVVAWRRTTRRCRKRRITDDRSLGERPRISLCQSHRVLGEVYGRKGEKEKAINHFETALRIASPFKWQDELFWIHYALAQLFLTEDELDDANTHIEQAKSHAVDNTYNLGRGMEFQARIWYRQSRLEDARSEALGALEIYEKLGAAQDVGKCRELLQEIEHVMDFFLAAASVTLFFPRTHPLFWV